MKEIQGYLCIIPNDPDGRGMLYFTEEAANTAKYNMDKTVSDNWDKEGIFDKQHWKEKPLPCEVYALTCCKNTTNG